MLKLVILADDLTGALDTGVQFASSGVKTAVTIGTIPPEDCTAAVCDLETRHVSPADAFIRTREAVQAAMACDVRCFYLKTDSGLRGNIGAALSALCTADSRVLFAPSYPENGRITCGGVHRINGIPVSQSLFGQDARNPVLHDRVTDILHETADDPVRELRKGETIPSEEGIFIADAETDADLAVWAETALDAGITCFAGCAGFAKQLEANLCLPRDPVQKPDGRRPLLAVCGSISPVSLSQLAQARTAGIPCFRLEEAENSGFSSVQQALRQSGCAVVASAFNEADIRENAGELPETIAGRLGEVVRRAMDMAACGLYIIGGDTLMTAVHALGTCTIRPSFEITSGVVLCSLSRNGSEHLLITKSGSLGCPDAVIAVLRQFACSTGKN